MAWLIAEGLTNREIARRLYISRRTAESHVEQILIKWGLRNRVQIASRVGETVRLHKRTMLVQRASIDMMGALWKVQDDGGLGYAEAMVATATAQVNVARLSVGLTPVPAGDSGCPDVLNVVAKVRQQYGLTDIEVMKLLAEHQERITTYMLRTERHPNDPEARADEAPDR